MISEIQLRSKSKSGADDLFNEVSEYLKTQDNVPNDVSEAMGVLTQGLARTYDGFMETLKKGGSIPYDEISNCKLQNKKYIDIIRQYLRSGEINPTSKKLSEQLQMLSALDYMPRGIFDCPQDLLPSDKIYYHGTRHARKVYQNGFSPYVSNQLYRSPREFGAGIYTSPDIKVASGFSGKHGDIIPIKLNDDAKIAFVSAYSHQELFRKLYAILREEIGEEKFKNMPSKEKNALIEILTQKLFKESGYDAVYTPKGYRVGFNLFGGDINEQLGTPQSQVVIFSPEKTEITSRSFSERVGDLKAKKKTRKAMFEYQKNNLFAGLM